MQLFKYKGYDSNGKRIDGELVAHTIEEVERRVAAQAVTIISIIPAGVPKGGGAQVLELVTSSKRQGRKVSDADVATVLRDLAVMAETGVPFVEALDAVIETARTITIEQALKRFKSEIVGGKGLSAGMRAANGMFPLIVCDMVKIAEEGGRLDKALSSAATYVERSAELKRKIMNAMLYPIVLTVISMSTIVIMLTFVLPKFADIFNKMGAKVPVSTQVLLGVGQFLKGHPFQMLFIIAAIFFGARALLRVPSINRQVFLLLLKLPVVGELLRRLSLSRAFSSVSTLLNSNVTMLQALEHGAKVAGNPIIRDGLMHARNAVEHGAPLSDSMKETKAFPSVLVRMVAVGERTGRLAMLMSNTALHMEEEVDGRLKALISIVEPVMIVIMGCIVGALTMSIIIPMYTVMQDIH